MGYAVAIERADHSHSASVPGLAGCITTGTSVDEVAREMAGAVQFHLDGMREDGLVPPEPSSVVDSIDA